MAKRVKKKGGIAFPVPPIDHLMAVLIEAESACLGPATKALLDGVFASPVEVAELLSFLNEVLEDCQRVRSGLIETFGRARVLSLRSQGLVGPDYGLALLWEIEHSIAGPATKHCEEVWQDWPPDERSQLRERTIAAAGRGRDIWIETNGRDVWHWTQSDESAA